MNAVRQYRIRALKVMGGENPICCNCGCNDMRILEINHVHCDGAAERKRDKSSNALFRSIISGSADLSRYNILCKVCNWLHYVQVGLGISGHRITWKGPLNVRHANEVRKKLWSRRKQAYYAAVFASKPTEETVA